MEEKKLPLSDQILLIGFSMATPKLAKNLETRLLELNAAARKAVLLTDLEKQFSYSLSQSGNRFPTVCTIWNEYGLSVGAEAGTAEEAIQLALEETKKGKWR